MCGTNKPVQTSKATRRNPGPMIILLVVASIPCVLVVVVIVVGALSHVGVSPRPSQPTATATETATPSYTGPSYAGRLLLQELTSDYSLLGTRELQEGWIEPREVTDPAFDASLITGRIRAVSPDRRYLVFDPHFLLDTETGTTTPLLTPGLTGGEPDYRVYGVAFSPDGNRVAYGAYRSRPALFTLDITTKQTRMIHDSRCATYGLYGAGGVKLCECSGDPSWIDSDTLVFAYREGLPRTYTEGSDDEPNVCNHIEVATYQGEVILSTESPPRYEYRAIGETVFVFRESIGTGLNHSDIASAWLDAADLRNGIYEAHQLDGFKFLESVSPDGRYILEYSFDESQWSLFEVRTGQETILATAPPLREDEWPGGCVWSPDETAVACVTIYRFAAAYELNILLIPLSDEPGGIVFSDAIWHWMLFDWRP